MLALTSVVVLLVAGVVGMVGYVVTVAASAPDIETLRATAVPRGSVSTVYAADGTRLGFIESDELRTPVPSSRIPQNIRDATVAIEDQRFYEHEGVDIEGIIRAVFKNITSGKTIQGGSTITMQLVRNLYISNERTFERKIKEAKLAEELEEVHSKPWILTTYLNSVSYGTVGGQTAVGVQAAARTFFNKPARELELHEAALLAGLPQAPSLYNPFDNPEAAQARRNRVLDAMADQRKITLAEAEEAKAEPLGVKRNTFFTARRESYFFDYVKEELIKEYGVQNVRKGGLRIRTTIDLRLQKAARAAIAQRLSFSGAPSSAIVTIDPKTGYIRAMASSAKYAKSKFNLAAQGHRQPGSTFKVMVLMAALKRGVDPDRTYYVSKPLQEGWLPDAPDYAPKTYDNTYGGTRSITQATLKSDNSIYAQLDADIGPDEVKETAQEMGITSKLNGFYAEGLGGLEYGVSPLEMANAYATIVSGGWRNKPIAITKVEFPDGRVEDFSKPKRTKVFDDGYAHKAVQILRQNVQSGTGTAASGVCQAAGKTGTTDKHNDAWFVGFTPKYSTAVWVGFPDAQVEMSTLYHGGPVAGGTFPTEIWGDYMKAAVNGDCPDYPQPTEKATFTPFFGKYSVTGTAKAYQYQEQFEDGDEGGRESPRRRGGSRRETYDPDLYESPPQPPPNTRPPPGGGGGGGTGGAEPPD